jgi:hypothetical protein
MKKFILCIYTILASAPLMLDAQTVVIREEVTTDTTIATNEKWNGGYFTDFTFYAGGDEKGMQGTFIRSLGITILPNIKYNISNKVAAVFTFGYIYEQYGFKKSSPNVSFPDSMSYNKNRFSHSSLVLGLGLTYKIGKQGYLQLGALAKWGFFHSYKYQTSNTDGNKVDIVIRNPGYFNEFTYDAYARLGVEGMGIVAYLRLNDLFAKTSQAPAVYEVPRLRLGIGFGL